MAGADLVAGQSHWRSPPAAPGERPPRRAARRPVELKVSLFGTFGYEEAGLFASTRSENPGVTIIYESTQSEDDYWPALQTRLAPATACRRAGHRGRPHRRRHDQPGRPLDRPARHPGRAPGRHYIDWKETAAATTEDGAVLGLGTDIGPMALCYRSRPARRRPGCPPTPTTLAAQMPTWDDFLALGEKYKATAPDGQRLDRLRGRPLQRDHLQPSRRSTTTSPASWSAPATRPCKQAFDTAARAGQSGLTAKLEQFVDPGWDKGFGSGTSPPSPARPG